MLAVAMNRGLARQHLPEPASTYCSVYYCGSQSILLLSEYLSNQRLSRDIALVVVLPGYTYFLYIST